MKLGMVTNFGTASSFFALVFEIDESYINYSCISDMSFLCPTWINDNEKFYEVSFWDGQFNYHVCF